MIHPPPSLFIFGAGDDAQPLARFAEQLGWRVTVADPRAALATSGRFPDADATLVGPSGDLVARAAPGPGALAVVMTHNYSHDLNLIRNLLPRPLAFLGLLGPRQRADRILDVLAGEGVPITPKARSTLHAPVGLDIGAESPEDVALSIIAEMRAALSSRNARPLREKKGRIHA